MKKMPICRKCKYCVMERKYCPVTYGWTSNTNNDFICVNVIFGGYSIAPSIDPVTGYRIAGDRKGESCFVLRRDWRDNNKPFCGLEGKYFEPKDCWIKVLWRKIFGK